MVLDRASQTIEHRSFCDLKSFLREGDLAVLNDTRVLPARRFSDNGAIEFLFLEKVGAGRWRCLAKPGRKMRVGATAILDDINLRVEEILPGGERIISFDREIDPYLAGQMPLPPYIARPGNVEDEARYQTVFARQSGAIAAPTAGLHFTDEILGGLPHVFITLHVGTGTFRPVQSEDIRAHQMHPEKFSISEAAAEQINKANRILAVGTTTVRALETAARESRPVKPGRFAGAPITAQTSETNLFIYPPFEFRLVDLLLTNFHLPRSTLLILVSAFAGREFLLRAYAEAVREQYRFYSYGDCMLIL